MLHLVISETKRTFPLIPGLTFCSVQMDQYHRCHVKLRCMKNGSLARLFWRNIFFFPATDLFCWLAQGCWLPRVVGCAWKQMSHVLLSSLTTSNSSPNWESPEHLNTTLLLESNMNHCEIFWNKRQLFPNEPFQWPQIQRKSFVHPVSCLSVVLWFTTGYLKSCKEKVKY